MTASVWAPGSTNVPVADPKSQIKSQIFVATSGQTSFILTQFTYNPNGGALEIYVNGTKRAGNRVTESSTSTFTLLDACDEGDVVEAVGNTEMASADGAAQTAVNAATDAQAYRDAALTYKNAAETAKTGAETAKTAAETAAANAVANVPVAIHAATNKPTPVDADEVGIWDSVSGLLNRVTWANVKATLKSYFDTLYQAVGSYWSLTQQPTLRNKIINGGFDIWQRGTSFTSSAGSWTYTADRWGITSAGTNITAAKVDYSTDYGLVITGAAGNTGTYTRQCIEAENAKRLAGKTVMVSFLVFHTDTTTVNWQVSYPNSKDVFAVNTVIASGTVNTVAGNYTLVSFSFAAPANVTNGLELQLYVNSLVAAKQLGFRKVQLEEGSITPFESRPIGVELALCRRYVRPIKRNIGQATAATASIHYYDIAEMRAIPTLSTSSGWVNSTSNGGTAANTPATQTSINGDLLITTTTSGLVAGDSTALIPPAGALFIAEL